MFSHEIHVKSIDEAREKSKTRYFWILNYLSDYSCFDFIWEPVPWESEFIHAWPSQWQKDGQTYLVPKEKSVGTKYHKNIIPRILSEKNWEIPKDCIDDNFDFTWHPDPTEPPYIYQFGTQHQKTGGPRYVVPNATEVKYERSTIVKKTSIDNNWEIPSDIDVNNFDFTWHPDETESPYIYQFGTQHQKTGGPRYVMEGATETKFIRGIKAKKTSIDDNWEIPTGVTFEEFDYTWHPDETESPYIYQFGTQHQKTGGPRYRMSGATETKFIRGIKAKKTSIDDNWEVSPDIDVENFDYTWHPDETESPYIYQFGTQHQKTGGPRYITKGSTETKFVRNIYANVKSSPAKKVFFIDHYDGNIDKSIESVNSTDLEILKTRYSSNYLSTIRRIAKKVGDDSEYIWICSSVCDYTDFNFSWHPEQWQSNMVHVFPSNEQKFGDTFFIHVPSILDQLDVELLEWHNINFLSDISVPRWNCPEVKHDDDSHIDVIKNQNLLAPLTIFSCDNVNTDDIKNTPTVPLWEEKTKTIVPLSDGGSSVIVPRESIAFINDQLYDYPYIDKTFSGICDDKPLDIVFISNGETNAEENWEHLLSVTADKSNRVARVDGINGRVAAYQAALEESNTDWAFCVFAKLKVNPEFDWSWQPDRMQQRKHYIFHAKNPVNFLEYGHMAMIAYNKKLTLQNTGGGLDFTLDQEHDVVPLLSGTAEFNNDPWMTWRTAFRECLKLRDSLPNIENEYRLETWLSVGDGNNGDWSVRGAEDAVRYYESVNGDFEKLKLSYEWKWLQEFFNREYSQ